MKKYRIALILLSVFAFFNACQKELSFENAGVLSVGLLQSDLTGDCLPKTVAGVYEAGKALDATNYIDVTVDVVQAGSYLIYTDTTNGIYFRATGIFTTNGVNTVRLKGNGTPVVDGISNFIVTYGVSQCTVPVTILPSGGTTPAVFTLSTGPGGECMSAVVSGTYTTGTAVTPANQVVINVNVTTAGTYNVSTSQVNGISFSGSGTLATGAQTITLAAAGTPGPAGTTTIPVTVGSSACNFSVTVAGPAVFTVNCGSAVVTGTLTAGTALTAGNTIDIQVTVTTPGAYTITGSVNNMTFSKTGTFPAAGPATVTLAGSGTPATDGSFNLSVTGGTAPCNVSLTVAPGTTPASDYFPRTVNSNWSYEMDDDSNDSVLVKVIPQTKVVAGNTFNIFMGTDDASAGFDTSGYYRKSGGTYNRFQNLVYYLSFDNDQRVEFTFLKDDQPAGHTWTTAAYSGTVLGGIPISVRIIFKILQKDVTTTVNGIPYANTIVIEERYEVNLGAGWEDGTFAYGYYKDYYSRNVGWILDELYDETDALIQKQEMRRSQVF